MATTRLKRIHHRGELKEHRAGKDDDRQQDNGLARRKISDGQQLRESDNTRQDADDDKYKEHHAQGSERL